MIYLDYSASTPVDPRILKDFEVFNQEYYANPNSLHELGVFAKHQVDKSSKLIQEVLGYEYFEIIYTSGATEANNLALKGYALANVNKGKHIITTPYEHSSVTACLNYLEKQGFEVDVLELDKFGAIDLRDLKKLIRDDTILLSVAAVNSELGILQDLDAIKEIVKAYPKLKFHSDMTQAIGKIRVDLAGIDLVTFSGHKIYGIKGVGALLRRPDIDLQAVIHGGKSTSVFRGGTPAAPLIHSLALAVKYAYQDFDKKLQHIKELSLFLKEQLNEIKNVKINHKSAIPQILNLSFLDILAGDLQQALSKRQIYISTQSACASEMPYSHTVKRITGSDRLAETSVRISLSHLSKKQEIIDFIDAVKEILDENR